MKNLKINKVDTFLKKLVNLAQKKRKCIDVFLEEKQKKLSAPTYLKGGKFKIGRLLLDQVRDNFYNCAFHALNVVKKKCPYTNIRFHNFDLRFSNSTALQRTSNKLDILLYYNDSTSSYSHKRDYSLLSDYILGKKITKQNTLKLNKIISTLVSNPGELINTPSYSKVYSIKEIKHDMKEFRRLIVKEYTKFIKNKEK